VGSKALTFYSRLQCCSSLALHSSPWRGALPRSHSAAPSAESQHFSQSSREKAPAQHRAVAFQVDCEGAPAGAGSRTPSPRLAGAIPAWHHARVMVICAGTSNASLVVHDAPWVDGGGIASHFESCQVRSRSTHSPRESQKKRRPDLGPRATTLWAAIWKCHRTRASVRLVKRQDERLWR
jgi:hypothetical protein